MDLQTSVRAWEDFTDLLADAASVLDWKGLELDDLDRAEGLRYLARLTNVAVNAQLGTETSLHPSFRLLSNGFGMDNPDNRYLGAPVDPTSEYVIRGHMGPLSYLSFATQSQNYARTDSITGGGSHLRGDELVVDADGRFEITAGREARPGNWLQLEADTTLLLVRQTRADPTTEQWIDLQIECVGIDDAPPPLDPGRIAGRLSMVALFTVGASQWFVDWVSPWLERPNTFERADPTQQQLVGGDPNILCQSGYWNLEPTEALVVEFTPPNCDYWNIQLANVWAESFDTSRAAWRNNVSAIPESDGSVRAVIAHRDPGHPNWLDTAGHHHGLMHMRFVHSDASPLASTRLVHLDDVPKGPYPMALR
jgi:hypothetical protein